MKQNPDGWEAENLRIFGIFLKIFYNNVFNNINVLIY